MAKARPLVDGFLERISVKAFDGYHKEITRLVRGEHGVYALYKNDRLYYVGLASNLRNRIKQHLKDKHANRWNRFSLYLVRKVDHIREIESLLLRIAGPAGNKQGGRLRRAVNLERTLRQMMMQSQKVELETIFSRQARGRQVKRKHSRKKAMSRRPRRSDRADRSLKGSFAAKRLYATYKGRSYRAIVYRSGRIKLGGRFYNSPSAAAKAVCKRPVNGWWFWKARHDGELVRLITLRP